MPRIPPEENRFKPGESGNPSGRPRGSKNTQTLIAEFFKNKELMQDPTTGKMKKLSVKQRIILAQINQALKGNTKAFNALIDRLEGKVAQQLEHTGKDGMPLAVPPQINMVGVIPAVEVDDAN